MLCGFVEIDQTGRLLLLSTICFEIAGTAYIGFANFYESLGRC